MKKTAFIAIPMLALVLLGGAIAGNVQISECKACEIGDTPPTAVVRDDDEASGIDNFLPDDDVFGQSGGLDEEQGGDNNGRPRPRPRERDGGESGERMPERREGRRPLPIANGDGNGSPNGDIYFIIYGHLPLPPTPQPGPEDNGAGELPDGELG